jgi:regulation of enolase protein 1 (concanavalin A-like superfamily)
MGTVGWAGEATYLAASGTFHLFGSGDSADIPQDEGHFVFQALEGDGTVVARLTSAENIFDSPMAGVMVRESADPGSAYLYLSMQSLDGGCQVSYRTATGGASSQTACNGTFGAPIWMKVTRDGADFSAQISSDGSTWTDAAPAATVGMAPKVLAGVAVASGRSDGISVTDFDNVALTTSGGGAQQ